MATEKELHKCKIELNSYKLNSSNIPIENKTQKDDQSEDSLLAKERFNPWVMVRILVIANFFLLRKCLNR